MLNVTNVLSTVGVTGSVTTTAPSSTSFNQPSSTQTAFHITGTIVNGTSTVFTVGAGKKRYLTLILLTANSNGAARLITIKKSGTNLINTIYLNYNNATNGTMLNLPLSVPIEFSAGETLEVVADSTDFTYFFSGFEVSV